MKVALFVHCFFPDHFYGTETYTLELAKNLIGLGHDVTVVSAVFQGEPANSDVISSYLYEGVPVVAFDKNFAPHSRISETYYQESTRVYLRRILRQLAPDIVHVTHLINHTAVLLEEARFAGVPAVATLTDFFGFCYNNKLEAASGKLCSGPNRLRSNCIACHLKGSEIFPATTSAMLDILPYGWEAAGLATRVANRFGKEIVDNAGGIVADIANRPDVLFKAYGSYHAMIAPSAFLLNAYRRRGFPVGKLHVSRFGVDIDRAYKPLRDDSAPIVVGYVGQIAPHKGVDLLVSAVSRLPAGKVSLRVYGPESQDPVYMKKLRGLAAANVKFCGTFPPEGMAAIMRDFDLLAIPSTWYENSPLVLLNALASHTPVIVSNVEGLTEFVDEGVNGWSFQRGNGGDLHDLLDRLLRNPEDIRSASRKTAYGRTPMSMTLEVEQIYKQVLGAGSSTTRADVSVCTS